MTTLSELRYVRNKVPIIVQTLNSEHLNLTGEKSSSIGDIFSEVCNYLDLEETDLFGLAHSTDFGMLFIDTTARISSLCFPGRKTTLFRTLSLLTPKNKCRSSSVISDLSLSTYPEIPILHFRVRFYIPNHCLHGRKVRHLYYQQLKNNVLSYGLLCSNEVYFQLAAYAIQADFGTTGDVSIKAAFRMENYFPCWLIAEFGEDYLYKNLPKLLEDLTDVTREALEFRYIRLASEKSSNFNLHMYRISSPLEPAILDTRYNEKIKMEKSIRSDHHESQPISKASQGSQWLGFSPFGMEFHEEYENGRIASLSGLNWNQIIKLSYKKNFFRVYTGYSGRVETDQPIIRTKLSFYTPSEIHAQHLFTLGRQMHVYQTTARLSSLYSAHQLEINERRQYNEAYIYSDGEIITSDARGEQNLPLDDINSPDFSESSHKLPFPIHSFKDTSRLF